MMSQVQILKLSLSAGIGGLDAVNHRTKNFGIYIF